FFADPGSGFDESDGERYWDGYIDAWAQRYGRRLKRKAVSGGATRHAVMWDMRDRRRQQTFTEAVDRFYRDVLERQVP
ncbi:terminase, partial [Streptomyces sp. A73]|nr:terminase [Streptomyces sp. A73]